MTIRPSLLAAAALLAHALPSPASAQAPDPAPTVPTTAPAASDACAHFDDTEAEGKAQVARRIAAIDEAANLGNAEGFCAATGDLVFVYRSMRDAGATCSTERAARWADALTRTEAALAGTCR